MTRRFTALRPARARGHRHLLTGSAVLVIGAAIQALSGFVFWLVAAKLDDRVDVGSAAKLNTLVLFVTYLAGLGLPVALARYASDHDEDSEATFSWGVLATIVSSIALSLACLAVIATVSTGVVDVLTDANPVLGPLAFAVIVVGTALSLIADVRCMTARRWNLVLFRITIVGLTRFPLLFLARSHGNRPFLLFLFATVPVAITGALAAAGVPRLTGGRHRLRHVPATRRATVHYAGVNYVSTLAYQAPYFALPVIVLSHVGSATYASFNVAWGIVAVAFYVPTALGQALLAEGGREGARLRSQVKLALLLATGLMTVGSAAAWVGSPLVETIYGSEYHDAARVLPVMMAAGVPWAITSLLLSQVRIEHRHVPTVAITAVLSLAIIVPALVMVPERGIDGASAAWFLGNLAAAVVAVTAAILRPGASGDPGPRLDEGDTAVEASEVAITMAEPSA